MNVSRRARSVLLADVRTGGTDARMRIRAAVIQSSGELDAVTEVGGCPCLAEAGSKKVMRDLGMTTTDPATPDEWRVHVWEEDAILFPKLLAMAEAWLPSDEFRDVANAVRVLSDEHNAMVYPAVKRGEMPDSDAMQRHGNAEVALLRKYGNRLRKFVGLPIHNDSLAEEATAMVGFAPSRVFVGGDDAKAPGPPTASPDASIAELDKQFEDAQSRSDDNRKASVAAARVKYKQQAQDWGGWVPGFGPAIVWTAMAFFDGADELAKRLYKDPGWNNETNVALAKQMSKNTWAWGFAPIKFDPDVDAGAQGYAAALAFRLDQLNAIATPGFRARWMRVVDWIAEHPNNATVLDLQFNGWLPFTLDAVTSTRRGAYTLARLLAEQAGVTREVSDKVVEAVVTQLGKMSGSSAPHEWRTQDKMGARFAELVRTADAVLSGAGVKFVPQGGTDGGTGEVMRVVPVPSAEAMRLEAAQTTKATKVAGGAVAALGGGALGFLGLIPGWGAAILGVVGLGAMASGLTTDTTAKETPAPRFKGIVRKPDPTVTAIDKLV